MRLDQAVRQLDSVGMEIDEFIRQWIKDQHHRDIDDLWDLLLATRESITNVIKSWDTAKETRRGS